MMWTITDVQHCKRQERFFNDNYLWISNFVLNNLARDPRNITTLGTIHIDEASAEVQNRFDCGRFLHPQATVSITQAMPLILVMLQIQALISVQVIILSHSLQGHLEMATISVYRAVWNMYISQTNDYRYDSVGQNLIRQLHTLGFKVMRLGMSWLSTLLLSLTPNALGELRQVYAIRTHKYFRKVGGRHR